MKREVYKTYKDGFYVYCPPSTHKSTSSCVDYVIRYVGRPVMASSRIFDFDSDNDHVLWHYEDHETKEHVDVWDTTLSFMKKLNIHIPDANFKMIRYIGGYATKKKKLTKLLKKMIEDKMKWVAQKTLNHREMRIQSTGIDPIACSCGAIMEFVDFFDPEGGMKYERWIFWIREPDPV